LPKNSISAAPPSAHGVRLALIARCGHFPMYANPAAMWHQIADFQRRTL